MCTLRIIFDVEGSAALDCCPSWCSRYSICLLYTVPYHSTCIHFHLSSYKGMLSLRQGNLIILFQLVSSETSLTALVRAIVITSSSSECYSIVTLTCICHHYFSQTERGVLYLITNNLIDKTWSVTSEHATYCCSMLLSRLIVNSRWCKWWFLRLMHAWCVLERKLKLKLRSNQIKKTQIAW